MENKNKHLEFIQNIIERLSGNSFMIKKWCVAIVSAILVVGAKDKNNTITIVSLIPITTLWILDGFYLYKERLFRMLYKKVSLLKESQIDFDMDTDEFKGYKNLWISAIFSRTLMFFYFTIYLSMILFIRLLM
ncbi:hypothetical protein [Clostridium sp.]|uniref:hypothetical protein n=1 Tax=Clostridium sp. TaxID=1506 RepID=UPI0028487F46|nr:hypothetical protein [Clostridium sp.]MDR3596505.1 hypothetical protein [Clostridium sp.]